MKEFAMLAGEHWWGGTTDTKLCPITEKSGYHYDFRKTCPNQTAPLFLSDMGRVLWSDSPFKVDIENGVFAIEGGAPEMTHPGTNLREAYLAAQAAHFPPDGTVLRDEFFVGAQYNTWMEFTYYPEQEAVLEYARGWLERGFEPGIFILDEGWHQHTDYGHWEFDRARFPDPKAMVDELHGMGFKVMLWVVPYVNACGPRYVRSLRPLKGTDPVMAQHLYLRNADGEVVLTRWWNGASAILDMTDEWNRKFLDDQLRHLMDDYGVDGFKFDGGSVDGYAHERMINGVLPEGKTPQILNTAWNEFGLRYPFHEYKDTWKGGGRNGIQRLHDRSHTWTDNGIDDVIPCGLNAGLIGHPFLCPDMVGGGEWSYRFLPGFDVDEELFVRMAQCSALFPMMQFSWAPWKALSEENTRLCLQAAKLHKRLAPEILALKAESEQSGEPMLRTLEYVDPHQGFAEINDEYLLGSDILAAPVVTPQTRQREVVFPEGAWTDDAGRVFEGRTRVTLPCPLDTLLWFRRVK